MKFNFIEFLRILEMYKKKTMFKVVNFIILLSYGKSFSLNENPKTWRFLGSTPPLTNFDPLGFSSPYNEKGVKWLRESELTHSRFAMLAFPTLVGLDILDADKLAINQLSSLSANEQFPFWFGVACFELVRMFQGWKNPFEGGKYFSLKDDYQPGYVLKFMPFNNVTKISDRQFNSELNNGRLAMLATVGYIVQELMQNTKVV